MDLSPNRRHGQSPSGPRHMQSLTEAQMAHTSQPAYVAAPTQEKGHPEMAQISNKSAFLPSTATRHSRSRQTAPASHHSTQPTVRAVQESESGTAVNYHPPSQSSSRYTGYPDRNYPHAPPPARHRSRSPAHSPPPPASRMEAQSTTTNHSHHPPSTLSASRQQRQGESLHQRTPFQSAQAYHVQRQRDPHRLLPTPVRGPRGFSFELAPANNEFVYTPPRTSDNENISDQIRPPPFRPVLRPVPGTVRDVSADDLALIFARPVVFDESRRMPGGLTEDPNIRQEFAEGFIYDTGVDYEAVEEEIPSSPPVFDQYMLFEEGRIESDEGHSTIRQVSEDDAGDFSQVEMPGMWQ